MMNNFMEQKLYELHAQMCQVFTSSKRLEILNLLRDTELSVGELTKFTKIRQANLSQHLGILREKGIVKTKREGTTIYYSLANPKIGRAFDIIRKMLLEKLAQTEKLSQDVRKAKKG
jgi:ArsR family transcriptional regulator